MCRQLRCRSTRAHRGRTEYLRVAGRLALRTRSFEYGRWQKQVVAPASLAFEDMAQAWCFGWLEMSKARSSHTIPASPAIRAYPQHAYGAHFKVYIPVSAHCTSLHSPTSIVACGSPIVDKVDPGPSQILKARCPTSFCTSSSCIFSCRIALARRPVPRHTVRGTKLCFT